MQKILWCALLMLCVRSVHACDICGCAAPGSQLGILPHFQKHFISLRYQYSGFDSKPHDGIAEDQQNSREMFHTSQLWGRLAVHKKIHLFAFLPYKVNRRETPSGETYVKGMGDAMLLTNLILISSSQDSKHTLKHLLQFGTGIKLPTGKSDAVQNGLMLHTNMQAGSGSYDIPFNVIYTLRYKSYGANAEINFTKNGMNKQHFQFGDRTTASIRFFTWKNARQFSILPSAGTTYENANRDRQNSEIQDYTGGSSLLANAGLDLYYKQFGLNLLFQKAIWQNMGDGYISNNPRAMANFIYLF